MKMIRLLVVVMLLVFMVPAAAMSALIDDTGANAYWGAVFSNPSQGDVLGQYFNVDSATVNKVGTKLTVTLSGGYFTNFLNGVQSTNSYGPGDLYINPTGWIVSGTDAHHATDTFTSAENWAFVVRGANLNPNHQEGSFQSNVYLTNFGQITMTAAPLHPVTPTPYAQAWAGGYGNLVTNAEVLFGKDNNGIGFMSFIIDDVSGMHLGGANSEIGMHWTMRCGNDVVEGQSKVPEPSTMLLIGAGLAGLGLIRKRWSN